ncbi:MATE family efflux transporter [Cystobacter fuscus]|uniref:MATE family efflux transporter n=1 Tax=Cystobacter fuscus TaxID=43 RepID=UPI002B2ECC04|nr:MATE family efflux transporter [Cystobacter fuscus]
MNSSNSSRLLEENIPRLLLSFSMPAIIAMLAQAFYNLIDRVFLGHAIGRLGIAGTTVSFPFMTFTMAFGLLVGYGSTALVSIRLGEKKMDEAERVLGNALSLLLALGISLAAISLVFIDPLLGLFGASAEVLPYARDYMSIILVGTPLQMLGSGLSGTVRGEGNPKLAMGAMLLSVVVNAILAPIFIFTLNGGMKGAAWATVAAQALSALVVFSYYIRGKSQVRLRASNLRLDPAVTKGILAVGAPPFALHISTTISNSLFNHQLLVTGGDLAVSVMGIIYSFMIVITLPIMGVNMGAQPIIGFNFGAKRYDRVKETFKYAALGGIFIASAGFLVAMFFPGALVKVFNNNDDQLVEFGVHAIRLSLLFLPVAGFQMVCSGYFQAVGKPKHAMFLTLSRQFLLLIPALLILPGLFGVDGVWYSIIASDLAAAVLTLALLAREMRDFNRAMVAT